MSSGPAASLFGERAQCMISLAVSAVGILAVIALLGVSALFADSEIALFSLPGSWIDQQAATGNRRAVLQ